MSEQPESYAAWQQKRGRAADLIDWAVNEYDEWMLDDHYDARSILDGIIGRFREYRAESVPPPPSDTRNNVLLRNLATNLSDAATLLEASLSEPTRQLCIQLMREVAAALKSVEGE